MANANFASIPGASGVSRWWRVVGGVSMNLALGSLYAWSVFVAPLEKEFGWKRADTSDGIHHRRGRLRANIHRSWPAAGQAWAFRFP